jgi:hypothetical protein
MNAGDYARYSAAARRRQSSRANTIILLIVMFGAIPVALILRLAWMHLSGNTRIGDTAGYVGLFAYLLGAYAMLVAMSVIQRLARNRVVAATPNAFETKTAVFDATGIAVAGKLSDATWRWGAIQDFTRDRDLLLLWIGPFSAITIPTRSFEDARAREAAAAFIRSHMADAGRSSSK